jgi:arylsulfatase A-like enzyme
MIAASGAKPDPKYPLDGEDLRDVISGKRPPFERTFFWRTFRQGGMRSGKWKFVREGKAEFLFDLSIDEHEQANFAGEQPGKLAELHAQFDTWAASMQQYPKE